MKKLESSIKNMVVVLVGVSIVTGGLLAYVNKITTTPIEQKSIKTLTDGIKNVMGGGELKVVSNDTVKQSVDGKELLYVIHVAEDAKGNPLGAAVESSVNGFGGELKVLVGFNPDGVILGYTILQSSETPGLGAKADKWFQKDGKGEIIGLEPGKEKLTVSKDGGSVNAITASTITSRAFLKAVNNAYDAYKNDFIDAQAGASQQVSDKCEKEH